MYSVHAQPRDIESRRLLSPTYLIWPYLVDECKVIVSKEAESVPNLEDGHSCGSECKACPSRHIPHPAYSPSPAVEAPNSIDIHLQSPSLPVNPSKASDHLVPIYSPRTLDPWKCRRFRLLVNPFDLLPTPCPPRQHRHPLCTSTDSMGRRTHGEIRQNTAAGSRHLIALPRPDSLREELEGSRNGDTQSECHHRR